MACAPDTLTVSLDVHVRLHKLLTAKWWKFRYNFNELKDILSMTQDQVRSNDYIMSIMCKLICTFYIDGCHSVKHASQSWQALCES